ncbi:MAG: LemA family protein, partial [Longimicrobiales bacterium]
VQECTRFARRARCHTITLWTNSVLAAARGIYEREGYRLVGEKPHESFGHDLIGHLGACAVNGTSDGPGTTGRTVDRVVVKTLGTRWTRSDVELAGPRQRADPSNMRAILIAAVALLLLAILLYNRLVSRRNQADYALASVDALLKKRHDLVPNLVATVRGYMTHERDVLERVTELRTRAHGLPIGTAARMDAEAGLAAALSGVLVRVEAYPELRASENVLQLQAALNEVEEQISAARRFFNAAVADYNNAIEMFPSSLVANTAGMKRRAFFEIPTVERATPRAALGD